jgi:hypothetical protein
MTTEDDNITDEAECLAAVEVRLAEEALAKAQASLAAARAKVARRAKVCADLRAAAQLVRDALCDALNAREESLELIDTDGTGFWDDDDRNGHWTDLLEAADNAYDAEKAAIALAEHIEKNGENI